MSQKMNYQNKCMNLFKSIKSLRKNSDSNYDQSLLGEGPWKFSLYRRMLLSKGYQIDLINADNYAELVDMRENKIVASLYILDDGILKINGIKNLNPQLLEDIRVIETKIQGVPVKLEIMDLN